jgi:hypothetical protein
MEIRDGRLAAHYKRSPNLLRGPEMRAYLFHLRWGGIRRRGKRSWQLRFDDGIDATGRRKPRWARVRGTHQNAQKELTGLPPNIRTRPRGSSPDQGLIDQAAL